MIALAGISIALTAASTGLSFYQQDQQAKYQNEMARNNAISAKNAYANELAMQDMRQRQEEQAYGQQQLAVETEGMRARGAVQASTESTAGTNVAELLTEFDRNTAERQQSLLFNREAGALQGAFERVGAAATAENRIRSVPTAQRPNPLGAVLSFGGGVASTVGQVGFAKGWWGTNRVGVS